MAALDIFRELTSVPTAPFYEQAVTAEVLGWIRGNLGGRVRVTKARGGVLVSYRGAGDGPQLGLAAHLDHPAFHLSRVTAAGAEAKLMGGLTRELLPGAAIEAFPALPKGNAPAAIGRLGKPAQPDSDVFPITWTHPPARGTRLAFAVLALAPCKTEGGWVDSRSIDDLMGCAISLETVRILAAEKAKANVLVQLHRAEEVGFIGALDLIRDGRVSLEDSILSIETSKELPDAVPGQGPVIRVGDRQSLFDPNLLALLDAAAEGRKVQRTRLTGGSCEATAYLAFGYESAGVAIPLVNYHNNGGAVVAAERVREEDIAGAVDFLAEAARRFPLHPSRGQVRKRLSARLRAMSKLL